MEFVWMFMLFMERLPNPFGFWLLSCLSRSWISFPNAFSTTLFSFFHFILRFWNQVLTWSGVSCSWWAKLFRPWVDRYFSLSNRCSRSKSCLRVKTVRVRRKRRLSSMKSRKYFGTGQITEEITEGFNTCGSGGPEEKLHCEMGWKKKKPKWLAFLVLWNNTGNFMTYSLRMICEFYSNSVLVKGSRRF